MKKAFGIIIAIAMLSTLALTASAVNFGSIEGDGWWRIEIFNEWGDTGPPSAPVVVGADEKLEITFTLSGMPAGSYTAYLGTSGSWQFKNDSPFSVVVSGDGTYTITAQWDEGIEIEQVLVVDIEGLATALGIDPEGEGDDGGVTATATRTVSSAAAQQEAPPVRLDGDVKAGVGDVAVASAIALVAVGAVVFSRKKK
jgi:hypothetical protein